MSAVRKDYKPPPPPCQYGKEALLQDWTHHERSVTGHSSGGGFLLVRGCLSRGQLSLLQEWGTSHSCPAVRGGTVCLWTPQWLRNDGFKGVTCGA
ncbi:unnamed protein product [Allacma fusca]|uniref:Uncharacterized protein n=1 Tax=Allacma fusca TaxID=39272 RepID=A0A8J2K1V0_9HEXA|nr:unnamed protein product [Allacma fusca]